MGRVIMYLTIAMTIMVLAPLFGIQTATMFILDFFLNVSGLLAEFLGTSIWTTILSIVAVFGVGSIFIGTTFKIPLELIALIPYTILLLPLAGDLLVINNYLGSICTGSAQLGCFAVTLVNLVSFVLFAGFLHSVISWWAGRNS